MPHHDHSIASTDGSDHDVATLRGRARSLRSQAAALDDVLALTYRRRASELEMEARILEVLSGAAVDEVLAAS
jgi:superfamily I DNA/RNA helicase